MVFRGKPSKGCQACRKRRIKCDRRPEGCTSCQRAGWTCPGYRNELDLMFCDESESTIRRIESTKAAAKHVVKGSDASSERFTLGQQNVPQGVLPDSLASVVSAPLEPCLDDFALACFRFHHVMPSDSGTSVWDMSDGLAAAMKALGMATFSANVFAPALLANSRKRYVSAVRSLNKVLAMPTEAKKDSTLLAVMILTGYEAVTASNSRSIDAWQQHINGTAALVELRGTGQFDTAYGRIMFLQTTATLLGHVKKTASRMPASIRTLMKEFLRRYQDSQDPLLLNQVVNMEVNDFNSDVFHGRIHDPASIISKALQLDRENVSVFDNASPIWSYKVYHTVPEGQSFTDLIPYCHEYSNEVVAQVWTSMRGSRMRLHRIIINTLERSDPTKIPTIDGPAQIEESMQIINKMQLDTLACVPQQLGFDFGSSHRVDKQIAGAALSFVPKGPWSPNPEVGTIDLPVLRTTRGYNFLGSLLYVGDIASPGSKIRQAIPPLIRLLGKSYGIQQAFVFADMLDRANVAGVMANL